MEHYIDKDVLVAWAKETYLCENASMVRKVCYKQLLEHLDTLEVKEVNLKQSYRDYINKTYTEEFAQSILDDNVKGDLDSSDLFGIMFYGFELGMQVSSKAQKGE